MSLRFVSKSVLTSSDGVSHDEEKPIHNNAHDGGKSDHNSAASTYVPPIWQQLEANAQAMQDSYDETTREKFRGTKLLDEEDVEYLSSLDEAKIDLERQVRRQEEELMHSFRLEQLQKIHKTSAHSLLNHEQEDTQQDKLDIHGKEKQTMKRPNVPMVAIRKVKRKIQPEANDGQSSEALQQNSPADSIQPIDQGLLNLIGYYESDSSD